MGLVSLKNKELILCRLSLFLDLIENFSDSKKQLKCIKKLVYNFSLKTQEEKYLLDESDKEEAKHFITEMKELVLRYYKAKSIDDYSRAGALKKRYTAELYDAIKQADIELIKNKGENLLENIITESVGGFLQKGISKAKNEFKKFIIE